MTDSSCRLREAVANEYSIEIHKYLSAKIAEAETLIAASAEGNPKSQGALEELLWLREYLSNNIDLKDFTYY